MALIRNSREGEYPDVVKFGRICIAAGANGLTVHPRPDQRHIRPHDVFNLHALTKNAQDVEFNIEGNPFAGPREDYPGFMALVEASRPDQCTLVPDDEQQLTSDHGFDLSESFNSLAPIVKQLKNWGIRVSLFMDPEPEQIRRVKDLGADRIELYTGPFAQAFDHSLDHAKKIFQRHCEAAETALSLGLGVNAGHDLNLANMALYRNLPGLKEVSIGHALTVDALLMGFEKTVKEYLDVCR